MMLYILGAIVLVALPFALPFPRLFIGLAGITLPFSASLAVQAGGAWVAACDVMAILALVTASIHWKNLPASNGNPLLISRPYKAIIGLAVPYFLVALFDATMVYPSLHVYLDILQRGLIIFLWMALGSVAVQAGAIKHFLWWFVATNLAMSVAWLITPGAAGVLGVQKNPSGGFIAAAFLIVLLSRRPNRQRIPALLLLTAGLVCTGSRGSMLGLSIAIVFLAFFLRQWKRMLVPGSFAAVAVIAALNVLPEDVTARILSQDNAGIYNIDIRQVFIDDAMLQFQSSPWAGLGVGNYKQITPMLQRVATHDPHNVFVLSLVEGGWPLLVAFIILMGGTLLWLLSRPKSGAVVLAVGVQLSTLAHAYVDVYWVRGTPSIGWLLIGAAAASVYGMKAQPRASRPKAARPPRLSPAYARLAAKSQASPAAQPR